MKKYILFDLDGTLTDPEEGITKSIQYALSHMGINIEDRTTLRKHIGPPLKEGFMEMWGFDEEQAKEAVVWYREIFTKEGMYQNKVYPGVQQVLDDLVKSGKTLILATSKPEKFAKIIMDHFDLSQYFTDICGSSLDGTRSKKGDVIRYALEKNHIMQTGEVVMVGDRLHDVVGAKENGLMSIGVLYGFGSREELTKAGADKIAKDFEELKKILIDECD